MSFGQILQWTKTITYPGSGEYSSFPALVNAISNNISTSAILYGENLYWFDSKGNVIHSENISQVGRPVLHGIASNRLVMSYVVSPDSVFINTVYKTFTRKGKTVTSTEINSGAEFFSGFDRSDRLISSASRDACGFFKFEKGEGDTWIIKRYIF